jgi:hypothetical protein
MIFLAASTSITNSGGRPSRRTCECGLGHAGCWAKLRRDRDGRLSAAEDAIPPRHSSGEDRVDSSKIGFRGRFVPGNARRYYWNALVTDPRAERRPLCRPSGAGFTRYVATFFEPNATGARGSSNFRGPRRPDVRDARDLEVVRIDEPAS